VFLIIKCCHCHLQKLFCFENFVRMVLCTICVWHIAYEKWWHLLGQQEYFFNTGPIFFASSQNFFHLHFLALSSGVEVVTFLSDGVYEDVLLVSGFQSSLQSSDAFKSNNVAAKSTATTNGILAIDAADGTQRWRRTLFAKPTNHDCHLVSVKKLQNLLKVKKLYRGKTIPKSLKISQEWLI